MKTGILKAVENISLEKYKKIFTIYKRLNNMEQDFSENDIESGIVDENEDEYDYRNIGQIYAITIDDKTYIIYEDLDDGFRSLSYIEEYPELKSITPLIRPIKVVYGKIDDDASQTNKFLILNQKNCSLIFETYTDYSDSYYPLGIIHYHPENIGRV